MNPAKRFTRKIVVGTTLVALAVLVGMLIWTQPRRHPYGETATEPSTAPNPDGMVGSSLLPGGEAENIAQLPDTDRQPVTTALGTTGGTSLLVRVVEHGTGEPVLGFGVTLTPAEAMSSPFGYEVLEGVTDGRGEVLWENIEWNRVAIYPSITPEWFGLEEGELNEHVHEV